LGKERRGKGVVDECSSSSSGSSSSESDSSESESQDLERPECCQTGMVRWMTFPRESRGRREERAGE